MSKHYSQAALETLATTSPARDGLSGRAERTFGLPPRLFVATIGGYFAFLGIMGAAFMNAELVIPFAIFAIYIIMAFGVPGLWARVAGPPSGRVQSWDEFREEGMRIAAGHISGSAASVQVLLLPALVIFWALAVAVIVATL
jgi:hypothetical protein